MRTFTFTMHDRDGSTYQGAAEQRVSIEFTSNSGDATVDDMMYHFKKFLQACDYCFHLNDIIEVVSEFKESQDQVKDMLHD